MMKAKVEPKSLTPEAIAIAALEILRDGGPNALSLRRVGEKLGTNHVAVYRRCGSFDGLLDLCADYVAAGLPMVPDTLNWATATQMRFENVYDMWAEHADLIMLMRGRAWNGMNMVSRFCEPALRGIFESGMTISEAQAVFSILYRLTLGSVVATMANPWSPMEGRAALNTLGRHHFPTLSLMLESDADDADARGSYSEALRKLIAELGSRKLENRPAATTTA